MPKLGTPDQVTNKLLERVAGAGGAWEAGISNPKHDPVAAMKAANGKWKAAVTKAVQNDTWNKKISQLTAGAIQAVAMAAAGAKFSARVAQRKDKILAALTRLLPKIAAVQATVAAMPQDNEQQREARMLTNLRGMRAIKGS